MVILLLVGRASVQPCSAQEPGDLPPVIVQCVIDGVTDLPQATAARLSIAALPHVRMARVCPETRNVLIHADRDHAPTVPMLNAALAGAGMQVRCLRQSTGDGDLPWLDPDRCSAPSSSLDPETE